MKRRPAQKKSKKKQKKEEAQVQETSLPIQKKNPDGEREKLRRLFKVFARNRNAEIREQLVLAHTRLVVNLAKRFANRGEPLKDLIQVGNVGLIQAVDRFDVKRGVEFITFATPTVLGEIKRYFRDKGWTLKVPRRLQELNQHATKAIDALTQEFSRSPTIRELAQHLDISEEEVLEALELGQAYNPLSLDAELTAEGDDSAAKLLDLAGGLDKDIEGLTAKESLQDALLQLPEAERAIVVLRFFKNYTQMEVAKKLRVSQMQISRLQQRAMRKLRYMLGYGNESK